MADTERNELLETIKNLTAQLEKVTAENADLRRKLDRMNELLLNAQQARFGQSSEKKKYVLPNSEQLSLFNEAEAEQDVKAPEPTEESIVSAHSRKRKRTMEELIKDLPVKEVLVKIPEDMMTCDRCGGKMRPIGKKLAYRELEIIPKQVFIREVYCETYACEDCEKNTGFANIMPSRPSVFSSTVWRRPTRWQM